MRTKREILLERAAKAKAWRREVAARRREQENFKLAIAAVTPTPGRIIFMPKPSPWWKLWA